MSESGLRHDVLTWSSKKGKANMANYMCQVTYSPEAIRALIKNPQDRSAVVRGAVEKLGGKVLGFWYSFGEHDAVLIVEMPDNSSAAALPLAAAAGGGISASHTTVLLSPAEGIAAMKKAARSGYRPPGK